MHWNLTRKKRHQVLWIVVIGLLLAAGVGWTDAKGQESTRISRKAPGEGTQEKEFLVDVPGEMEDYPLKLEIAEKKLSKAQREEYLEKAKDELDMLILGENPSKDEVTESLNLPAYLQEGAVEAAYDFSDYDIFRPDGTIAEEPERPTLVEVMVELTCQEEECLYQFSVCVVPREKSGQELLAENIESRISAQNEQENSDYITLPSEVEGKEIHWRKDEMNRGFIVLFLTAAAVFGLIFKEKEEAKHVADEREKQMLMDYSGIVGKLSLLLGAGMNISLAWEKIALSYQEKRERGEMEMRYAYEEMLHTLHEIRDGVGELQAYENFGNRCALSVYRRFAALIVQNVRKGAHGMQKLLEQEEWESYEQRKARAKQAGEEAGTKLLFPMGIMLVIVLVILVVPAGMSLNF